MKTSLNIAVTAIVCGLSILVAVYSYIGENPQQKSITAVCMMLLGVMLSVGGVWLTNLYKWKMWVAYIVPSILVCASGVAMYAIGDFIPNRVDADMWLCVLLCMTTSSVVLVLYTTHVTFEYYATERHMRDKIPDFKIVSSETVMNQECWNADPDLLLSCAPQRGALNAFVGAGNDIVVLIAAFVTSPRAKALYGVFSFPDQETFVLPSGKHMRRCIALRKDDSSTVIFSFILDPNRGDGVVMTAGSPT